MTRIKQERKCKYCGRVIPAGSGNRKRYCSNRCKQADYRRRKIAMLADMPR